VTKISLGISPSYVENWGPDKAIRELLQNYLDSKTEFGCKGSVRWHAGRGIIRDFGPGIEPRHLALGISEKSINAIGKYGEGLKLAMLVLVREGRHFVIEARGRRIIPSIEYDATLRTETLHLTMEPCEYLQGTRIEFECSKEELEAGKMCFEAFTQKGITWVEKGKISLPAGKIYVNGAAVGSIPDALFSYHLRESEVGHVGNRDREVVDVAKVEPIVRGMLRDTSSGQVRARLLNTLISNDHEERSSWEARVAPDHSDMAISRKTAWYRSFREVLPPKTVISSSTDMDTQARYRGYQPLYVNWPWQYFLTSIGVKFSHTVIAESFKRVIIPLHKLEAEERSTLNRAKELVSRYYHTPTTVTICDRLRLSAYRGALGLFDSNKNVIYLTRPILSDLRKTLSTLLHETCHQVSGEEDCTSGFQDALCNMAADVMLQK
jgi:hypothetical protein